MKSLAGFKILAGLILMLGAATAHTVAWGDVFAVQSDITLLAEETNCVEPAWSRIQNVYVDFPPKGYNNSVTITSIQAKDLGHIGPFFKARLIKGGAGHSYATIKFTSTPGKVLHYRVRFYGFHN